MRIFVTFKKKSKTVKFKQELLSLVAHDKIYTNIKTTSLLSKPMKSSKKTKKIQKKCLDRFKTGLLKASRIKPKRPSKPIYKIEIMD